MTATSVGTVSTAATFQPPNEAVKTPFFPYEVSVIVLSYACDFEKEGQHSFEQREGKLFYSRLGQIGQVFGMSAERLLETVFLAQQADSLRLPTQVTHALWLQATAPREEASLPPKRGEQLFRHFDLLLRNHKKRGKALPEPSLVLNRINTLCPLPVALPKKPEDQFLTISLPVRWSVSDSSKSAQNDSYAEILTLFLKHYPNHPVRLISTHPEGPNEEAYDPLTSSAPFVNLKSDWSFAGHEDAFVVFEHRCAEETRIAFRNSVLRPQFLEKSVVRAILQSGKTFSYEDLITALYLELTINVEKPDADYVDQLLSAGADPHYLGNTLYTGMEYSYVDRPNRAGVPILFLAFSNMLQAHDNPNDILKYEANVLSLLIQRGARYAPANLRHEYAAGKTTTPTIVDWLISKHYHLENLVLERIQRFVKDQNLLPNCFSLTKLICKRASTLSPFIDAIVDRSPERLKQITDEPSLLKNIVWSGAHSLFIALCQKHKVPILPLVWAGVLAAMDSEMSAFPPDNSIELPPLEQNPYKEVDFKIDPTSQEAAEGFLRVVRKAGELSETAKGTQNILLWVLTILQHQELLTSPKDLVMAALAFAENSPTHTSLCLLLRNLLQELGGSAPVATTAAAAISPTTLFG